MFIFHIIFSDKFLIIVYLYCFFMYYVLLHNYLSPGSLMTVLSFLSFSVMHEHLDIVTVNAQSLLAHFDEFLYYFSCNKFHIICVTESWLTPSIGSSLVNVPEYNLFRSDRTCRRGGGVACYVAENIKCRLLEPSVGSEFFVWVYMP